MSLWRSCRDFKIDDLRSDVLRRLRRFCKYSITLEHDWKYQSNLANMESGNLSDVVLSSHALLSVVRCMDSRYM